MASIDYSEKIPNNVNLARGPHAAARARALAAELPALVAGHGPGGRAGLRRLPAHRDQRRSAGLGAVRLREDARLPLGHLPRRPGGCATQDPLRRPSGRDRRGRTFPASIARTCAASSSRKATPSRRRSSSSASSASPRRRCTTCATCSRSTSRKAATCGRWCTCCTRTSAATAARRPRHCSSAAPATATTRASSAHSTSRTADWLAFFMFTYFTDRDGKFQLNALAESGFDPLARTTKFMLTEEAHHMFVGESRRVARRPAHLRSDEASSAPTTPARCAPPASSTCPRSSAISTSTTASRSTCSAPTSPATPRSSTAAGSKAASRKASATTITG